MIGYCCINNSLRKTHTVNRTMRKQTFLEKGMEYVSELVYKNISDLHDILKWNKEKGIMMYRLSSDMFPWMSEYALQEMPSFSSIANKLKNIGDYIKSEGMRTSFHPGPFNVLGSQNENVVRKTIIELDKHSEIMDLMGLDQSHYYPINIHVAATNPSKEKITETFCKNFEFLAEGTKKRLTVENDDKESQYTPNDLYEMIHCRTNIPVCFDQYHFSLGNQDMSLQDALELSLLTWGDIKPLTHHSSSRRVEYNDDKIKKTAHADFIYEPIQTFGYEFDTDLEAKAKEGAVLDYYDKWGK